MADEEALGQDWRSVEIRAADHVALGTARKRAAEPGRGREARRPEEIPSRGWVDILWRVVGSIPQDRVSATAGGVAFFALLAVFTPWLYAPDDPRKRLAWFAGATLLAAALAVRAYMTA